MKRASDWWAENQDDERWLDDPAPLLEQLQADAFAAGLAAGVELAAQRAATADQVLPHQAYYQCRALARLIRGLDIEMRVDELFERAQQEDQEEPDATS